MGLNGTYPALKEIQEIRNGDELKKFGNFKVLHTPGHSYGSVTLITETKDCFTGDLILGSFTTANSPSLPNIYEDMNDVKESVGKLLETECETFHPGHGFPFNRKSLFELINKKQ